MPNWFELPNEKLLETLKEVWYIKSPKLIGKLVKRGAFYFFTDTRSHEFRKVEYPDNPYNKEIEILFSPEDDSNLIVNAYYEFFIGVRDLEKRIVKNRLQVLFASKKNFIQLTPKPFIERRSKVYTGINIELADTIRKAIKTLTSDINREPETFIYELLQNADDYKDINKKSVNVNFTITSNYLILTHDGQPFNFQNVYALTGISQGDKRDKTETIGFKGIGFKSIFKDSNFAIVKSGGFEFKFDESCFPKEAKRPWQIIPIWVNSYDDELLENVHFKSAPVSIAIKPNNGNDKLRLIDKSYKNILSKVFQDDRILIFLRWIDKVNIIDTTDLSYKIELNKNKEKWFISSGLSEIEVDDSVRNWLNKQISDEDITIPEKYENIQRTKITFAVERNGSKILGTNNSKIYNYLPTEIDFGFKFLINGDFIPDGSRTELHNNEWNNYLGKIAGSKFVEWLSILANHKWSSYNGENRYFDRDFLSIIPNFNDPKAIGSGKNIFFFEQFKDGFKEAVIGENSIAFVPTKFGTIEILSNILVDETDLAVLLSSDFEKLTGIKNKPIHHGIGEGLYRVKELIHEFNVGIIFSISELKILIQQDNFKEWLKIPTNNFKFIKHLFDSTNTELNSLLETENIILSESNELFKAREIYTSIPDQISFITEKRVNSNLKGLLEKSNVVLKTIDFNAVEFLITHKETIDSHLISKSNILNFWNYIYDSWDGLKENDEIKKSLKQYNILCKPIKVEEINIKQISSTYLPKEIAEDHEVESIIESLKLTDKSFIDPIFLFSSHRKSPKVWSEIFFGAKRGLSDLIGELIKQLSEIEDLLHFKACNEIFKYWSKNRDKPEKQLSNQQLDILKQHLRLKCTDTVYRNATECVISDYFNNNKLIASWLPEIELPNQVAQEYALKSSQISEWKLFFVAIGCKELQDKQDIFDVKVNHFIDSQVDIRSTHFEIIKALSDLHKSKKENGLKFEKDIFNIQLQTKNNEWVLAKDIHFPDTFNPKLRLENDDTVNKGINILNSIYQSNGIEKYFLIEIGVNDSFKFFTRDLRRQELPQEYRDFIDSENNYISQNALQYGNQHRITDHIDLNYKELLLNEKYSHVFWDEVMKPNSKYLKYLFQRSTYKTAFQSTSFDNYIVSFIKNNLTFPSKNGQLKKPSELFSIKLSDFIEDLNDLPKYDLSEIYNSNEKGKSLEELLGVKSLLSEKKIIKLLGKSEDRLTLDQIKNLGITSILADYQPSQNEIDEVFLLNEDGDWKRPCELILTLEGEFDISSSQKLNKEFHGIAKHFKVNELSESNLVLVTDPEIPSQSIELNEFFKYFGKYIAFKLDCENYESLEESFNEKIQSVTFFEVNSILKVYPADNPIFTSEMKLLFDDFESKLFYQGNWKTNDPLKQFLLSEILGINLPYRWFDNLILRWNEKDIIEKLIDEFGDKVPFTFNSIHQDNTKEDIANSDISNDEETINPFRDITPADEIFIRSIIKGDFELNEKLDANTTAKIKTLMAIKDEYGSSSISDEGRFLKAGTDEIIVRSAQNGLLYLDVFHWSRLNESNVKLSIYTKSQIEIFNNQEDLIKYTKPQNKFGIVRMPNDYNLDDYNSLDTISDKGKWHFVFIVNENTKAAQNYMEVMNLDDYNF